MTGLLDAIELECVRNDLEATLSDTCTIAYVTRTADGMGGWTEAYTNRGASIACRLMPLNFGRRPGISAEQLKEGKVWVLSLHHDQAVAIDDKVTHTSDVYRVQQINANESEIIAKRVHLVRWE